MENQYTLTEKIQKQLSILLDRIGNVPDYLIPKINVANDYAFPFIDIGFDGSVYYVIRERGFESERILFHNIDSLLFKVFENLTFELAMKEELESRKSNEGFSIQKVYNIQVELMKKANPDWIIKI